jgi:predicted metalloprotease with PDZ domain
MLRFKAGLENGPWQIVIRKPNDMDVCTAHSLFRRSAEEDIVTASSYYELIRKPVAYTPGFPVSFKSGKTSFRVSVFRQGGSMSEKEIIEAVKPVCEAARFFSGGLQAESHHIMLHFLDPKKSNLSLGSGAIQMGESSVICLPDHASELKRRRDVQYALAHELMHLYAPLAIPTDLTSKVNLRAQRPSENLWYYEGFTEYLSLLMLYRSRLISEDEFMAEIRNRISLSGSYEPFNLAEESRSIYIPGHSAAYSNFYYKGAVVAFLLDLRLMYMSRGVMNLPSLLEKVSKGVPEGLVMRDERLSAELLERSYTELKSFFERYVYGADPIPYNEFLPVIGWFYEEERRDRISLYVDALFRFDRSSKKFYLLNITFDQAGFQEGDYLLKVNGRRLRESNYGEVMADLSSVEGSHSAVFYILRQGRRIRLEAVPVEMNRVRRDFIRIEPKPGDEMAFFRELYRSGQTLDRAYQIIN